MGKITEQPWVQAAIDVADIPTAVEIANNGSRSRM